MKNTILSILTLLLVTSSCKVEKQVSKTSDLEVYANSIFQASIDSAQIAGGAILVYQKGKMLLNKSYGYASLELAAPMPSNGIFDIGSVTKQFTAAAILKLVEAGKLSLEDDFTKYLPFDTKGRKVTINNLLNHTSGIPSYTEIPEFRDMSKMVYPEDSLVRLVERNEFMFEPNEALIYNNSAYFFLGLIIEKITGQTYEEFLKQAFFEPLGMSHTGYSSITEIVKNKVIGYGGYSKSGLKKGGYQNHVWPFSAGSLCSTTEDLLIWMKALHNGKVLTAPMYQSMISPDKLKDGSTVSYAKALVNFSNYGHKEISHGGAITGFSSFVQYLPDEDLYIICLINTIGPKKTGRFFAYDLTWKILDKKEYKKVPLDIDTKVVAGIYKGQTRDGMQSLEIKSIENGITRQVKGEEKIDTLKVYMGNNIWMDGNDIIIIKNNEYRVDKIYNYYILKK